MSPETSSANPVFSRITSGLAGLDTVLLGGVFEGGWSLSTAMKGSNAPEKSGLTW
jgi:hypothetical protein